MDKSNEVVMISTIIKQRNKKGSNPRKPRKKPSNSKNGSAAYFFAAIFLLVVSVALFISYAKNIPVWFIVLAAFILILMDFAYFNLGFAALK